MPRHSRRHSPLHALVLLACAWWVTGGALQGAQEWITYKDARLVPSGGNDADSFHVKAGGKEFLFRLYFVDAPETDTSFPARVAEQAKYFGLTPGQTIQLGELGARFTREKLAQPFTVRTCLQDARGRSRMPRYFAFIETQDGDLAELLVANGLARVYGASAQPVGLESPQRQWKKLEQLEREAKQQKVGGWGAAEGSMAARAATQPPKTGPDSFEAFFHPTRAAAAAAATPMPAATFPRSRSSSAPSAGAPGSKLDVNAASLEQLVALKGLGPVLAERIIAARPFKSADELQNVKGIGPKKYDQIREHFRDGGN
ncbi:hypothetical protein BH20VER2_BH20VER2_00150 [soil metagenome]|nr:helix-hairpin-helix domain-containing protein [Chthoniobacterales bacterium]